MLLLRKGKEVETNDFGNEGSGNQSYLKYMWKPEATYGFLIKGEPSPKMREHTEYTAWVKSPEEGWMLLASWSRPKGAKYLKGLYSFAENFIPQNGDRTRMCYYGRQWSHDTAGNWVESTTALADSRQKYRYDSEAGVRGHTYYLKHIGFFNTDFRNHAELQRKKDITPLEIAFTDLP